VPFLRASRPSESSCLGKIVFREERKRERERESEGERERGRGGESERKGEKRKRRNETLLSSYEHLRQQIPKGYRAWRDVSPSLFAIINTSIPVFCRWS
jgi:hypothetical protein